MEVRHGCCHAEGYGRALHVLGVDGLVEQKLLHAPIRKVGLQLSTEISHYCVCMQINVHKHWISEAKKFARFRMSACVDGMVKQGVLHAPICGVCLQP